MVLRQKELKKLDIKKSMNPLTNRVQIDINIIVHREISNGREKPKEMFNIWSNWGKVKSKLL